MPCGVAAAEDGRLPVRVLSGLAAPRLLDLAFEVLCLAGAPQRPPAEEVRRPEL